MNVYILALLDRPPSTDEWQLLPKSFAILAETEGSARRTAARYLKGFDDHITRTWLDNKKTRCRKVITSCKREAGTLAVSYTNADLTTYIRKNIQTLLKR
jgi:hypothetical protein